MAQGDRRWLDRLPQLPGKLVKGLTAFLGFIAVIVGTIRLLSTSDPLERGVLVVVVLVGTFLACFYIANKRVPGDGPESTLAWQYPRLRPWARAGLIMVPALAVVSGGALLYQRCCVSPGRLILVTNFDSPYQTAQVTQGILEELKRALTPADSIAVDYLDERLREPHGGARARQLGHDRKAMLVIWGYYKSDEREARTTVNLEILPRIDLLGPYGSLRHFSNPPAEILSPTFDRIQARDLPGLSLLIAGVAKYHESRLQEAIVLLEKARALIGGDSQLATARPQPDSNRAILHLFLGNAYFLSGDLAQAARAYREAALAAEDSQQNPTIVEPLNNLGLVLTDRDSIPQAVSVLDEAEQLCQQGGHAPCAYVAYNLGNALSDQGDCRRPVPLFQQALARATGAVGGSPEKADAGFVTAVHQSLAYCHTILAEEAPGPAQRDSGYAAAEREWNLAVTGSESGAGGEIRAGLLLVRARIELGSSRWDSAAHLIDRAEAERDSSVLPAAYLLRSVVQFCQGDAAGSVTSLQQFEGASYQGRAEHARLWRFYGEFTQHC